VSKPYQVLPPTAPVPAPDDVLERLVREGARRMLQDALEREVDDFLGRVRYQRTGAYRGYRNGHLTTHLEGVSPSIQEAQGDELLQGPANTALPVVIGGDFNSAGVGGPDPSTTYHNFTPGSPGLACGEARSRVFR
jgi:hypothetical protein